ncbi:MAG: phosphatase PAP2 family protein [Oscillospiraceae bacterium]|jgi:undecaprenyl-diphosphatase|nr:phosphatase PAP2 family protein [Oscillospiraceae bacterium]
MFEKIQEIDDNILSKIDVLRTHKLDKIMVFITNMGNSGGIWLFLGLTFMLIRGHRRKGAEIFVAVGTATLMSEVVFKNIAKRSRPCERVPEKIMLISKPTSYSFPSGHTTSSFASAYVISNVFLANCGFIIFVLAFLLAFVISFSRLYLKVHYPSDVLVGMLLGLMCGVIALWVF